MVAGKIVRASRSCFFDLGEKRARYFCWSGNTSLVICAEVCYTAGMRFFLCVGVVVASVGAVAAPKYRVTDLGRQGISTMGSFANDGTIGVQMGSGLGWPECGAMAKSSTSKM